MGHAVRRNHSCSDAPLWPKCAAFIDISYSGARSARIVVIRLAPELFFARSHHQKMRDHVISWCLHASKRLVIIPEWMQAQDGQQPHISAIIPIRSVRQSRSEFAKQVLHPGSFTGFQEHSGKCVALVRLIADQFFQLRNRFFFCLDAPDFIRCDSKGVHQQFLSAPNPLSVKESPPFSAFLFNDVDGESSSIKPTVDKSWKSSVHFTSIKFSTGKFRAMKSLERVSLLHDQVSVIDWNRATSPFPALDSGLVRFMAQRRPLLFWVISG